MKACVSITITPLFFLCTSVNKLQPLAVIDLFHVRSRSGNTSRPFEGLRLCRRPQRGFSPFVFSFSFTILCNNCFNRDLSEMVLCQDLVQVKMRNFSDFNPPEAQPQCVFFYTIVRIHLVTYSYNGYEFVSYCRKLPDIRKSSSMPACNREF